MPHGMVEMRHGVERLYVYICCESQLVCMQNWPQDQFPLRKVGKMVLDQNIDNFHLEAEQIAFNPGTVVPGQSWSSAPL